MYKNVKKLNNRIIDNSVILTNIIITKSIVSLPGKDPMSALSDHDHERRHEHGQKHEQKYEQKNEYEYEEPEHQKIICNERIQYAYQHKISDLIKILTNHLREQGDIPILYCGDECAGTFEDFSEFCNPTKLEWSDDKVLMLGNFHTNGCDHRCYCLQLKYELKK